MRGENAWSRYGLASLLCLEGREYERAVSGMEMGLMERAGDLSYVKEGFRVLARCSGYDVLIRVYEQLPENVVADLREGENSIACLWRELRRALHMPEEEVPHGFDFNAEGRHS